MSEASGYPSVPKTVEDALLQLDDAALDDIEIAGYLKEVSAPPSKSADLDGLSAYLKKAERYATLPEEAQAQLVTAYQESVRLKKEVEAGNLSPVQVRRARSKISQGEQALEYLVMSNFRLCRAIVRQHIKGRFGGLDRSRAVDLEQELLSEANIGLTMAIQEFDPVKLAEFHVFAAKKIRMQVRTAIGQRNHAKVPPSWDRMYRIAQAASSELQSKLGRPATKDELNESVMAICKEWGFNHLSAEQQQLPAKELNDAIMAKLRKAGTLGALEHLDEVLFWLSPTTSLDTPTGEDGSSTLGDIVPSNAAGMTITTSSQGYEDPGALANLEFQELQATIKNVLQTLPERDRFIIEHRYGFVDGTMWPYTKLAAKCNVSSERIRQIEHAVLNRLNSPHANYSGLAAHLPSQFEKITTQQETSSTKSALKAKLNRK